MAVAMAIIITIIMMKSIISIRGIKRKLVNDREIRNVVFNWTTYFDDVLDYMKLNRDSSIK